jgi:hypothetical protein
LLVSRKEGGVVASTVAQNDRSEETEPVQFMRLSSEEREVICALRALAFGELRIIRREGRFSHMVTEITQKFGTVKPTV